MAYVVKKANNEEQALVLRNDVYQSNPLVQARKKFDLLGMKIFMIGLRGLNPHFSDKDKYFDADFKEMFIPTGKLTEIFGNTWYLSELKPACKKLFDAIVELNHSDGGFTLYHLFRKLEYIPNEGLYLRFEELLRPYILDLFESKGYTRINVEYLFKLSSPYAVRLLELLLQYQNIKLFKELKEIKRKFTVEEIRFALNVPEESYRDRMDNFRKFVLDDPIKEINKRTPYIVRYETIKQGRSIVGFEVIMDTYNLPKDDESNYKLKRNNDAVQTLCSMGFTERIARAIFAKCLDEADCFSRINRAQAVLDRNKKPIKNRLGFLRKAIEEDWQVGRVRGRRGENSASTSKRKQERVNNDMTPIGEIFKSMFSAPKTDSEPDSAPAKPLVIRVGKKQIPRALAEIFIKYIRKGEILDSVTETLRDYDTTVEEFKVTCEKYGL